MVVREENETHPLGDGLRTIRLTHAEGNAFPSNDEIKGRVQRSELKTSRSRYLLPILWGCALELWLYAILVQLFYPRSLNWPLATWVPTHLDHVAETAFVASIFFITAFIIWDAKRTMHPRPEKQPPTPNTTPHT